jgi:hypothetical protein
MGSIAMKKLLLATVFSAFAGAAVAADVPAPVYKAPPPTVSAGGFYMSLDGSWQRFDLPDYALGHHLLAPPGFVDAGALPLRQRFDGYLVRGSVGYFLPTSNTVFGSNTRLELGGLYGHASGTANGTVTSSGPFGTGVGSLLLNGVAAGNGYQCIPGQVCTINGSAATNYSNWQVHGRAAGDYRLGAVWFTPSLAVFGGEGRNNQSTTQVLGLSQFNPAIRNSTYNASTALRWSDVGARAGLDMKVDVTPWAAVGVGGWAGFASRRASLSGSDSYVDTLAGFFNGASTISGIGASTTALVANAEAGIAIKPLPALVLRGFVGVNYDSAVAGVKSPSITVFPGGITTPAGIGFSSQTSYYAGGGLTWAFNGIPAGMSALGR